MKRTLLILILTLPPLVTWGNDTVHKHNPHHKDTIVYIDSEMHFISDSTFVLHPNRLDWKPNARRSVWLATICPGLGQIYNRSYWKLPIVYGGLMGCAFAIAWNDSRFKDYKQAYRDIVTDVTLSEDPTRSYNLILAKSGYTIERMGGRAQYTATLQNKQNVFHRYRDISVVVAFVVYAMSVVDAFVDAQLFDFDISPDLTLNMTPQLNKDFMNRHTAELHLTFKIK